MKIAISGYVGVGKTTLSQELSRYLKEKYGIHAQLVIPSFKDIAASKGLSLEEFQEIASKDPNIDKEFDKYIKQMVQRYEHSIIGTWLAIWTIQDADLKIFLTTDLEVRIRRIMQRDGMDYETAKRHILIRDRQNYERYLNVYGIDISRPFDVAHLIINTTYFSVNDEIAIIDTALHRRGVLK
ncbi:MAG: cytidylate kinase family protein [Candidatus Micrarchaeota archaeon]|nr:cytidylate kinase family protein [Candidatus Micrarchaeota archaeon]MCX8154537.1 cytidylate kinase family protein [Candidatus Micrarchaeota archaeon]